MRILIVTLGVVVLAGCGHPIGSPPRSGDDKLYEAAGTRNSQLVAVIDSRAQRADRTLPFGTPSRDWRHLHSINGTLLIDTDPATGSTLHKLPLSRDYFLPRGSISGVSGGLSQDGRWLVLQSWDPIGTSRPDTTHLLVVDTGFRSAPIPIQIKGWFEFDAVSNDGMRVYLIEYVYRNIYRVRIYQVAAQQLDAQIVVDKTDPKDSMTGVRLMGVPSSDGTRLYSVYARENGGAFIHALPLDGQPFAFCIDLAGSGYAKSLDEMQWALALTPDGLRLYAANEAMGIVNEISTTSLSVTRTAHIGTAGATGSLFFQDVQAKETGGNAAVLSLDGSTLVIGGSSGLVWVDTGKLQAKNRALKDWRIHGLGLSPDGETLYAVNDMGMIAQVAMSSGSVIAQFDPKAGYPMAIMRVAAS